MNELIVNKTITTDDNVTIYQNIGINENLLYIVVGLITLILFFVVIGYIKDFIIWVFKMVNKNKKPNELELIKEIEKEIDEIDISEGGK